MDMVITEGRPEACADWTAKSMPDMMSLVDPEPIKKPSARHSLRDSTKCTLPTIRCDDFHAEKIDTLGYRVRGSSVNALDLFSDTLRLTNAEGLAADCPSNVRSMTIIIRSVQSRGVEHHLRSPLKLRVSSEYASVDHVDIHAGSSGAVEFVVECERCRVQVRS